MVVGLRRNFFAVPLRSYAKTKRFSSGEAFSPTWASRFRFDWRGLLAHRRNSYKYERMLAVDRLIMPTTSSKPHTTQREQNYAAFHFAAEPGFLSAHASL
jgi:hypothetical protein